MQQELVGTKKRFSIILLLGLWTELSVSNNTFCTKLIARRRSALKTPVIARWLDYKTTDLTDVAINSSQNPVGFVHIEWNGLWCGWLEIEAVEII